MSCSISIFSFSANCPKDIFLRHSYTAGDRGVQLNRYLLGISGVNDGVTDRCQTSCRGTPNCVGVTIKKPERSSSYQCYVHKDIEDIAERNRQSDFQATLYIRQMCGRYILIMVETIIRLVMQALV